MIKFDDFVAQQLQSNTISDEQLLDPVFFEDIKNAYIDVLAEDVGSQSRAKLSALGEFVLHEDKKSLNDFVSTPSSDPKQTPSTAPTDVVLDVQSDNQISDPNGVVGEFRKPVTDIKSEGVRALIMDGLVDHGPEAMSIVSQTVLNDSFEGSLGVNGKLDDETISLINETIDSRGEEAVFDALKNGRAELYKSLPGFSETGAESIGRLDKIALVSGQTNEEPADPRLREIPDSVVDNQVDTLIASEDTVQDDDNGTVENVARAVGTGLLKGFSDVPRFIGHVVNNDSLKELADGVDSIIDAPDSEFANSWYGQVFSGLGQVGGLIVGGIATAPAKIGTRLVSKFGSKKAAESAIVKKLDVMLFPGASGIAMGGVEQVNDYHNEVLERGEEIDPVTEKAALFLGGSVGLLESVFPGKILDTGYISKFTESFHKAFSGGRLRSGAGGAIVEGSTEALQSALHDAIGVALYDADPEVGEALNKALEEGSVGAGVGAIISSLLPKGISKAGGATPQQTVDRSPLETPEASEPSPVEPVADDATQVGERPAPSDSRLDGGDPLSSATTIETLETAQTSEPSKSIPSSTFAFEAGQAYQLGLEKGQSTIYKEDVFNSYQAAMPEVLERNNIENYDQLLAASVDAVKVEINNILDQTGIALVRGDNYKDTNEIRRDLDKKGGLSVGPGDFTGILDEVIPQPDRTADGDALGRRRVDADNITYGEALNALMNLSRLKAGVDFGYTSDLKAFGEVSPMFSDIANIAVSTHLRGRMVNQYTNNDNLKAFEAIQTIENEEIASGKLFTKQKQKAFDKLSKTAPPSFILPAQFTIGYNPDNDGPAQTDENLLTDESVQVRDAFTGLPPKENDGMSEYIKDTGRFFENNRAFGDIISGGKLSDLQESRIGVVKTTASIIQNNVLNKKDRRFENLARDALGKSKVATMEGKFIFEFYKQSRNDYVKSERAKDSGKSKTEIASDFDSLVKAILDGAVVLTKKNSAGLPVVDNLAQDSNGDYRGEILGTQISVPSEMIQPISRFAMIADRHRQVLLQVVDSQKEILNTRIDDLNFKISDDAATLAKAIDNAGVQGTDFKAFSDGDWISNLRNGSNEAFSYLNIALTQYFDTLAIQNKKAGLDGDVTDSTGLWNIFFDTAENSKSIQEFVIKSEGAFGTADQLSYEVLLALGGHTESKQIQTLFSDIQKSERMQQNLQSSIDFYNKVANNPLYISRAYRAYEEPRWLERMRNPQTKEEKANKESFRQELIDHTAIQNGSVDSDGNAVRTGAIISEADRILDNMIDSVEKRNSYISSHGHLVDGTEFVGSALLKRGDLSDAYRKFLGEYTDPEVQMEATVNRIGRAAYQSVLNSQIYDKFRNNGIYTESELRLLPPDQQRRLISITMPEEFNLFKQEKFHAEPEIANVVQSLHDPDFLIGLNFANVISSDFKKFNTVYSLGSGSANILAGLNTMVMAGAFPTPKNLSLAIKSYAQLFNALRNGDADFVRDIVERVGGSEANLQDILRFNEFGKSLPGKAVDRVLRNIPQSKGGIVDSVGTHLFGTIPKIFMDYYAMGDLGPKMFNYQFNKAMIEDKLGVESDVAAEMAQDITRKTSFDYSDVPKIVKQIRDIPFLGGGFLSWPTLTFTTAYNSMLTISNMHQLESVKWGMDNIPDFNPNNPTHLSSARRGFTANPAAFATSITARKLSGLGIGLFFSSVITAGLVGAAKGVGSLMGLEDDDEILANHDELEQHISALGPEYYKDTDKFIVDVNERGNTEWVNISRITNYGNFAEAKNALFNPDEPRASVRIGSAMDVLFGDYIKEGFGLQFINSFTDGTDKFGRPISSEDADISERLLDFANYFAQEAYINSSIDATFDQIKAWTMDQEFNERTGSPIEFEDTFLKLAGLRQIEFDPQKELSQRAFELKNRQSTASSYLTSQLRNFEELDDSDIVSYVTQRQSVFNDIMEDAESYIDHSRALGLSDQDIRAAFKRKIKKDDVNKLLRGVRPVLSLEKLGDSQIDRLGLSNLPQGAKRNFIRNYEKARKSLNNF